MESIVGEVDKDAVLEFVDELESGEVVALEASHVEDVSGWVSAMVEDRPSGIGVYLEVAGI